MKWMRGELLHSFDLRIPRPFLPLVTCVLDLGVRSILQHYTSKSVEPIRGHTIEELGLLTAARVRPMTSPSIPHGQDLLALQVFGECYLTAARRAVKAILLYDMNLTLSL